MRLGELRREIDRVDQRLLQILGRRFALVRMLGELKADADIQVRDSAREAEMLRARIASGRRFELDRELVTSVFHQILEQSVRIQSLAANKRRRRKSDKS